VNDNEEAEEGDEKPSYAGALSDRAIKTLPSHIGPKIRHKNPKISRKVLQKQEKDKKNPKKNRKRMAKETAEQISEALVPKKSRKSIPEAKPKSDKKMKRQRREAEDEKKFNSLVQSYKKRLMASENVGQKSKWFD
jgi:hypothetical protein